MHKPKSDEHTSLIINRRQDLPRSKRWGSDFFTLLLWCCWLYLWRPFFRVLWKILHLDSGSDGLTNNIFDQINTISFTRASEMLIGTSLLLIIISRVGREHHKVNNRTYQTEDYANYFQLPKAEIEEARVSQEVTVYHDNMGRITHIEPSISLHEADLPSNAQIIMPTGKIHTPL